HVGGGADQASAYVAPRPLPKRERTKTIEMDKVRIADAVNPRRVPTMPSIKVDRDSHPSGVGQRMSPVPPAPSSSPGPAPISSPGAADPVSSPGVPNATSAAPAEEEAIEVDLGVEPTPQSGMPRP